MSAVPEQHVEAPGDAVVQERAPKRSRSVKGAFTIRIDRHGNASAPPMAPPRFVPAAQDAIFDPRMATDDFGWQAVRDESGISRLYQGPQTRLSVTRDLCLKANGQVSIDGEIVPGLPNDIFVCALPAFLAQSHQAMVAGTCRALYWAYARFLHPDWFEPRGLRDTAAYYSCIPMPMRALMDGDLALFEKLAGPPLGDAAGVPYRWEVFHTSNSDNRRGSCDDRRCLPYAAHAALLGAYGPLWIDRYVQRVLTAAACYNGSDATFLVRVMDWLAAGFVGVCESDLYCDRHGAYPRREHEVDELLNCWDQIRIGSPHARSALALRTIETGFALAHGADPTRLALQLVTEEQLFTMTRFRASDGSCPVGPSVVALILMKRHGVTAVIRDHYSGAVPFIPAEFSSPLQRAFVDTGRDYGGIVPFVYAGWRPDPVVDPTRLLPGWRHVSGRAAEAFLEDLVRPVVSRFALPGTVPVPGDAQEGSVEHLWEGYVILLTDTHLLMDRVAASWLPHATSYGYNLAVAIGYACRPLLDWMYKMLAEGNAAVEPKAFRQHYAEVLRRFWTSPIIIALYDSPDVARLFLADLRRYLEDARPSRVDALTFLADLHEFRHNMQANRTDVMRLVRMNVVLALARANLAYYDVATDRFVSVFAPRAPWATRSVPDELEDALYVYCGDLRDPSQLAMHERDVLTQLTGFETVIAHAIDLTDTRFAETATDAHADVDTLGEADLVRYPSASDAHDTAAECRSLPYFVRRVLGILAIYAPAYTSQCERIVEMVSYLANGYARGAFAVTATNYYLNRLQIVRNSMRTDDLVRGPLIPALVKAIQRRALPAASQIRFKNAVQTWISAVATQCAATWCRVETERVKMAEANRIKMATAHGGRAPQTLEELTAWNGVYAAVLHASGHATASTPSTLKAFQHLLRDIGAAAAALMTPLERFELLAWTAIQPSLYACGCELRATLGLDANTCLAAIAYGTLVTRRSYSVALRALPLASEWDNNGAEESDTELVLGNDTEAFPLRFTHTILTHLVKADVATVLAFTRTVNVRAMVRSTNDVSMLTFFGALANMQTRDTAFVPLAHFFEECCGERRFGQLLRAYSARWILELASQMLAAVDRELEQRARQARAAEPARPLAVDDNAMDIDADAPVPAPEPRKTKQALTAEIQQLLRHTPRHEVRRVAYDALTGDAITCADAGKNWVVRIDWLLGHVRALSYPKFDVVSKVNKELKDAHPRVGPRAVAALPVKHRAQPAFESMALAIVERVRHYTVSDSILDLEDEMEGVEEDSGASDDESGVLDGQALPSPLRGKRPRPPESSAPSDDDGASSSAQMEDDTEQRADDNEDDDPFPLPLMNPWNNI